MTLERTGVWARFVTSVRDQDGQALVEYAMLLLLIAVAAIGAVRVFGLGVSTLYQSIVDAVP
jgi:Flp pilus assembly pilin Flp